MPAEATATTRTASADDRRATRRTGEVDREQLRQRAAAGGPAPRRAARSARRRGIRSMLPTSRSASANAIDERPHITSTSRSGEPAERPGHPEEHQHGDHVEDGGPRVADQVDARTRSGTRVCDRAPAPRAAPGTRPRHRPSATLDHQPALGPALHQPAGGSISTAQPPGAATSPSWAGPGPARPARRAGSAASTGTGWRTRARAGSHAGRKRSGK